jgi:hypothetical protein
MTFVSRPDDDLFEIRRELGQRAIMAALRGLSMPLHHLQTRHSINNQRNLSLK